MIQKFLVCVCALCLVFSCRRSNSNTAYTQKPEGYYYRLLAIGDGKVKPGSNAVLMCDAVLKTQDDSVFLNSRYSMMNAFYIELSSLTGAAGKSLFMDLVEGDSISLMVAKEAFFRTYFDTIAPRFCHKDSVVKMEVKINRILSTKEYALILQQQGREEEDKELNELALIDAYLKKNNLHIEPDNNGIYILEHTKTANEEVAFGKRIRISYSGFYLNGKPIDNGSQQLEFSFGTPDQLVKGLNIVIGNLKKGETTKIIVPSRLAFGESGSSNGSIPPYTPLVYNIKLIDIK